MFDWLYQTFCNKIVISYFTDLSNGKYLGELKNGKPWGQGYVMFNNGKSYKGNFVNGLRQGT